MPVNEIVWWFISIYVIYAFYKSIMALNDEVIQQRSEIIKLTNLLRSVDMYSARSAVGKDNECVNTNVQYMSLIDRDFIDYEDD